MTTLRRNLRTSFETILNEYLRTGQSYLGEEIPAELIDRLADAALEAVRADKIANRPGVNLKNADPAWAIIAGVKVETDGNIVAKEARDLFEVAFGMSPPWFSNKDWTDFADWVAKVYTEDKKTRGDRPGNCWLDYTLWRSNAGKYGHAMSNLGIRKNPGMLMDTGWPTFLAHSAMYPPSVEKPGRVESIRPVETDDNDIPRSY